MSNKLFESTSDLMDGELAGNDAELIQQISSVEELKQKWQRYHLVRDCLKGNLPESVTPDLHEKIHQALENEPTILAPKAKPAPAYLKPVAGLAIAASVTVAVLLGVQNFQNTQTPAGPANTVAQQQTTNVAPPAQFASFNDNPPQVQDVQSQEALERMNRYLINYNELRANSGVRGMPPYVRMIGHEAE